MSKVKRNPYTIQSQLREESGICFCEEVFEPFVEEEFIFLWSEDLAHCSSVLGFVAWVTGDEVFHAARVSWLWQVYIWDKESTHFIHPPMAAPRRTIV